MNNVTNLPARNILRFNYGKKPVLYSSIKYIESFAGNYSMVRLHDHGYICSSFTLKHYREKLEPQGDFFQVRKGLLINLNFINQIIDQEGKKWAVLTSGESFQLSRRCGQKLLSFLKDKEDLKMVC